MLEQTKAKQKTQSAEFTGGKGVLELACLGPRLKNSSCKGTKNMWELLQLGAIPKAQCASGLGGCEVLQLIREHSCTWNGHSTFWGGFGACGTEPVWWHKWLC